MDRILKRRRCRRDTEKESDGEYEMGLVQKMALTPLEDCSGAMKGGFRKADAAAMAVLFGG